MEFLYFYDQSLLNRGNLKHFDGSTGWYNGISESLTGITDNTQFSMMMTFQATGASPEGVLLSNYSNGSGFTLGINKSNRLYIHSPNQAHTFNVPLSKKNTIALTKAENNFGLYVYNHFSNEAESDIYSMVSAYENTGYLQLGGNNNYTAVYPTSNFQGTVDQIAVVDHALYESTLDSLLSGFKDYSVTGVSYSVVSESINTTYGNLTGTTGINNGTITGINTKIVNDSKTQLNAAYSGLTYTTGSLTGSSSSGFSAQGDIYFKTVLNSSYASGFNLSSTGILFPSGFSYASNIQYNVHYNHDGVENSLISLVGKYSNSDTQSGDFYVYTTISQKWSLSTGVQESSGYLNDFVMEGANIYSPNYNGITNWTGDGRNYNPSLVNQTPKYDLISNKYKADQSFLNDGIYAFINRERFNDPLGSDRIIDNCFYQDIVRYDNRLHYDEVTSGAWSNPTGSIHASNPVLPYRPRVLHVQGSLNGIDTLYLVREIDYQETSSKDLLYTNPCISPTGYDQTIRIN